MAGIGNNLYPPIFKKAYIPAFSKADSQSRIYFSLSAYNSLSNFHKGRVSQNNQIADLVQVSIQNQNSNYSALNLDKYPSGIMNTIMYEDPNKKTDDRYYIIINTSEDNGDLQVKVGQYYKVQIRFTSNKSSSPENSSNIPIEWFNNNIENFSEWSQVVLVKWIAQQPQLILRSFSDETQDRIFSLQEILLSGKVKFGDYDNEYLKKYQVFLYDSEGNLLENSGQILSNMYSNLNEINYKIRRNLENNKSYTIKIQLQSNNLYEWEKAYNFTLSLVQYTQIDPTDFSIEAIANKEAGQIDVYITSISPITKFGTNFVIRRSSSKDNFSTTDDMYIFLAEIDKPLNKIWSDRTIEYGVWYKYSIQQINVEGFRSNSIVCDTSIACFFEDIFLLSGDKQLRVRFNPQVSNYSHVVAESLTQTIGSKYPFIRRNGNMDYRTFSLSGTISHFMDKPAIMDLDKSEESSLGMKITRKSLYGESIANKYLQYNWEHRINDYNDYLYERDFREKVIEFLYDNTVKLYRSPTQGNIMVKLMNISFTPNNTLSRYIYDFTCTVQQVNEFSLQNCQQYNIIDTGEYTIQTENIDTFFGQVLVPNYNLYKPIDTTEDNIQAYDNRDISVVGKNTTFGTGDIIQNYILPKYQSFSTDTEEIKIDYLTNLTIEFTSSPYAIYKENDTYKIADSVDKANFIGHVININGQNVIVNTDGIYELSDPNVKIISLSFLSSEETGVITYEAAVSKTERTGQNVKNYEKIKKIGQLFGYFLPSDSIYKKIYLKYLYFSDYDSRQLEKITGIRIYAAPRTLFKVREKEQNVYKDFLIGQTELLEFFYEDTEITGIYAIGPKLTVTQNNSPRKNQYYIANQTYAKEQDIIDPKQNYVYNITTGTQGDVWLKSLIDQIYKTGNQSNMTNIFKQNIQITQQDIETTLFLKDLIGTSRQCIYYKKQWYLFSDGVVLGYPVEAIIDYYCQILKKEY